MTIASGAEVDAMITEIFKTVLAPYYVGPDDGFADFDMDDLDGDTLFLIALACFAVARTAAIAGSTSDAAARTWFQHMIDAHWEDPSSEGVGHD